MARSYRMSKVASLWIVMVAAGVLLTGCGGQKPAQVSAPQAARTSADAAEQGARALTEASGQVLPSKREAEAYRKAMASYRDAYARKLAEGEAGNQGMGPTAQEYREKYDAAVKATLDRSRYYMRLVASNPSNISTAGLADSYNQGVILNNLVVAEQVRDKLMRAEIEASASPDVARMWLEAARKQIGDDRSSDLYKEYAATCKKLEPVLAAAPAAAPASAPASRPAAAAPAAQPAPPAPATAAEHPAVSTGSQVAARPADDGPGFDELQNR